MKFFDTLVTKLNHGLMEAEKKEQKTIPTTEECIAICSNCLKLAHEHVLKSGFKDQDQEIYFFKHIKPAILAKLNYYVHVFRFENGKALYARNTLRQYFEKHLKEIERFAKQHKEFIQYFISGGTHRDSEYFLRYAIDLKSLGDASVFQMDTCFSTYYDFKAGEYLANVAFAKYLNQGMNEQVMAQPDVGGRDLNLRWTDKKVYLVELVYALYASNSINNGNVDIGEIAQAFQQIFKTDIEECYRTYVAIKGRKRSCTVFLEKLQQALNTRINKGILDEGA